MLTHLYWCILSQIIRINGRFFSSWNIKRPIHFIVRNQIPMPTKNWRNKKYAFFIITIIFLDCFCCCLNSEFVCQSNEKWWKLLRYFYGYISLLLGVIISWWKSVNKDIYSFFPTSLRNEKKMIWAKKNRNHSAECGWQANIKILVFDKKRSLQLHINYIESVGPVFSSENSRNRPVYRNQKHNKQKQWSSATTSLSQCPGSGIRSA